MSKRILLIGQYFYPEKISSGVLPYELATQLVKEGYDVQALVGYPKEYVEDGKKVNKKENVSGINVRRISYIQANRKNVIGRVINILSFSMSVLLHPFIFKKNDVYICFTNPPLLPFIVSLFGKINRKKVIVVLYDLYPDTAIKLGFISNKGMVARLFEKTNQYVYRNASKIVAISNEMKNYLINKKKVSENKIEVIHNWYDDIYCDVQYDVQFPLNVIYGGNMGHAQDMKTIMDLLLLMKGDSRFKFVFAGHGSDKEKLEKFISENDLNNCIVYEFLPKDEYDNLLKTANIAILSIKDEICGLGSPSKYYGYLALKKPIIAIVPKDSDIQKDIDEGKLGIGVRSGEHEKIRDYLIEVAQDTDILLQESEYAYRIFRGKYTLEILKDKYIDIIEG